MTEPIQIDGKSLTIEQIVAVARRGAKMRLEPVAAERMLESRRYVEGLVTKGDEAVYGINTGLGVFANRRISMADAAKLSRNLVLSHAVGVGEPFPDEVVRAAMLIRANTLALGHSGARPVVVETLLSMLNAGVTPVIPQQGSLGSSGDLAPLCHLAMVFTRGEEEDAESGQARADGRVMSGAEAMKAAGIERLVLGAKEGLALSNGTSFSAAVAALAVADGEQLLTHAELATALVFEALLGVTPALDERLHNARRHQGQRRVAEQLRSLLDGSTLIDSDERVQDAYSLRCAPQVLGPIEDTVAFVRRWVEDEINAATDNPLIFGDDGKRKAISGGNFHGEVLALGADYLAIALTEVGALAERQINRLLHKAYSAGLPAMLVARPAEAGLNSGLMMPHYTAVSLTLENRTLASPDSVHSMPTSAGQEDVNANSLNAAQHLRRVLENVEQILAIAFFAVTQAIALRLEQKPGAKLGRGTGAVYEALRKKIAVVEHDRFYQPDIQCVREMMQAGELMALARDTSPTR